MATIRVTVTDEQLAELDDYIAAVNANRKKHWRGKALLTRNQALANRALDNVSWDAARIWTFTRPSRRTGL